jgi:hypothetical protein
MGYSEFLNERTTLLKAKIGALGCYTPPRVLTNQDLEKMVATNDQWIVDRTGIRERHIVPPEMATSDMAIEAAKSALVERGLLLPLHGVPGAARPWRAWRLGIRSHRGLLGIRIWLDHGCAPGGRRHAP